MLVLVKRKEKLGRNSQKWKKLKVGEGPRGLARSNAFITGESSKGAKKHEQCL